MFISIYIIEHLYRLVPFHFLSPICSFPSQADVECGCIFLGLKMLTFLGKYLSQSVRSLPLHQFTALPHERTNKGCVPIARGAAWTSLSRLFKASCVSFINRGCGHLGREKTAVWGRQRVLEENNTWDYLQPFQVLGRPQIDTLRNNGELMSTIPGHWS